MAVQLVVIPDVYLPDGTVRRGTLADTFADREPVLLAKARIELERLSKVVGRDLMTVSEVLALERGLAYGLISRESGG